jgi:hypothetical protein
MAVFIAHSQSLTTLQQLQWMLSCSVLQKRLFLLLIFSSCTFYLLLIGMSDTEKEVGSEVSMIFVILLVVNVLHLSSCDGVQEMNINHSSYDGCCLLLQSGRW